MRQLGLCTAPTHNIRRSAHSTMRSISCATTRTAHKGTYTKAKTKALHSAARCRQTAQQPRHNTASTQTHPHHSKRLNQTHRRRSCDTESHDAGLAVSTPARTSSPAGDPAVRKHRSARQGPAAPQPRRQGRRRATARACRAFKPSEISKKKKINNTNSYQVRAREGVFYTLLVLF